MSNNSNTKESKKEESMEEGEVKEESKKEESKKEESKKEESKKEESMEEGEVKEESMEEGEVKEESMEEGEVKEESMEEGEVKEEVKEGDEKKEESNFFVETKESIFLKETLLDIENKEVELSSDEEDDDIVKIENNIEYNILDKYHPEIKQLNNNELNSKIILKRNKDGIIKDVNHTTLPIMTRYERAKIIGFRATQINAGADILIDIPDNIIDGITIARMELKQKKIPFIVRRPLPNGKSEYWDINDLEILE